MKITIEDVSGLPDALKTLVQTEGEANTLDLSGLMPAEDLTGLKNTVVNLRSQVGDWQKLGETPADVTAAMDTLREAAKGTGKGAEDAQAKLDAMEAKHSGELSELGAKLTATLQRTATSDLKAELAKAGFISEAIDDIALTAMARLQFNDDGTPKVLTSEGKPMIGSGADHGATLADLAAELATAKPYAVRDGGTGGGGKPPPNGGKPQAGLNRSTMKPAEKAAYIGKHGQPAYNQLPE